ncbi:MAG TPA: CsbD family protein [Oculatellaceae cyanobacterium]
MSLEDRAKAIAKNVEGKAQEILGDLTGDPTAKAEGKAKQAEAQVRHTIENIKDKAKRLIN